ncbi:hypothetical protein MalM25_09300 [Planctomycetes bacterium MalM25]|nr:hypothetical protein MalM25_09300 [Planctomycetes bacterium MalM25]
MGDFSGDGLVNTTDIDLLAANVGPVNGSNDQFDLNDDGVIDFRSSLASPGDYDSDVLIQDLLNSNYGDADLNGAVGDSDLTAFSQNWGMSAGWAEADWDGTGVVGDGDLTMLLTNWGWTAAVSVPEPNSAWLALSLAGFTLVRRRSYSATFLSAA